MAAAVIGCKLLVVGGAPGQFSGSNKKLEVYDPATDTWSTKDDMPTARRWLGAAAVGSRLYAVGGTGGTNKLEATL